MNEIVNLISNVGFPILMCLMMFKKIDNQDIAHKEEIEVLTKAIDNNTIILNQILEKIRG